MKVLFSHSYFLRFDKKQLRGSTPYPPLATLYAAAFLREQGHEVRIEDLQFSSDAGDIEVAISSYKPDVFVIYDDSFNYLTKMCLTNMRHAAFRMQEVARRYRVPVVVSSSDATDHAALYHAHGADYIILGEAEHTLSELLSAHFPGGDVSSIAGLSYVKADQITRTMPRKVMKDLDQLPQPAWDLIDLTPYRETWMKHHGYFSINAVTTRGCPYKCNWCAKPVYGNRYNSHSPGAIADLLAGLQKRSGFTHVWFADDIFGLKPGWISAFADHVQQEGLKFRYKIQSRADLLLDEEIVRDLKRSGCEEVWMGAESGSQKVLDAMDKGTTVEQIARATALLKKSGIRACFFLQFGYPGEDEKDIRETISMVESLMPDDIGVSVSYPLPGTVFYENVKSQLQEKSNWKDSDDLDVMFAGTYPREFYRHLQRFIHYRFRSLQGLQHLRKLQPDTRALLTPYYFVRSVSLKRKIREFGL